MKSTGKVQIYITMITGLAHAKGLYSMTPWMTAKYKRIQSVYFLRTYVFNWHNWNFFILIRLHLVWSIKKCLITVCCSYHHKNKLKLILLTIFVSNWGSNMNRRVFLHSASFLPVSLVAQILCTKKLILVRQTLQLSVVVLLNCPVV